MRRKVEIDEKVKNRSHESQKATKLKRRKAGPAIFRLVEQWGCLPGEVKVKQNPHNKKHLIVMTEDPYPAKIRPSSEAIQTLL